MELTFNSIDVTELTIPLILLTTIVIIIYWKTLKTAESDYKMYGEMPKIPFSLPIFGNLPRMGNRPYVTLMKWAQKYGQIFRAEFGAQHVVVLNSTDLIHFLYFI